MVVNLKRTEILEECAGKTCYNKGTKSRKVSRLIKNAKAVRSLEKAILRKELPDFSRNIRLVEALYKEAVSLGVFPPQDKLSGLDVDIKVARVINSVSKTA